MRPISLFPHSDLNMAPPCSDVDALAHCQFGLAVQVAASKVVKKPKEETSSERFARIRDTNEVKKIKKVKAAAKKSVKRKHLHKMSSYFSKV
jgi:hypothetical protein